MKILMILVFLIFAINVHGQTPVNQKGNSKKEAERLWELGVAAKGGREKLYAVRNMVESSDGNIYEGIKRVNIHLENLYVFPNKWWSWDDQRPSIFGLSMLMYNWETGKKYSVQYEGEPYKGLEPIGSEFEDTNLAGLIPYLLETKWNQPIPERMVSGKVKSKEVDIIQTMLRGKRIDFAMDKITHLPVRVISYTEQQKPGSTIRLADYVDISGIKMPSKVIFENSVGDMEYNRNYLFNIEYNENIFKTPPPFEAGPEAWKAKK